MNETKDHDPYAALRIPSFRFFLASSIVGVIGGQIQNVAIGWELYERTGLALTLAIVGGMRALPMILFSLPAGQLADTFDRKRLMMLSQSISMLCSIGLAIASYNHASLEIFYTLIFLRSSAASLGMPARGAMLPRIVTGPAFANAVSWGSSGFELALMSGPALGGLIIHFSIPLAYAIDAACMFTAVLCTAMIAYKKVDLPHVRPSLKGLVSGATFVWNHRLILPAITLDLFAVLLGGATALMPIYAKDILQVGETGMGWLRAAPAMGAVTMAVISAHRPPLQRAGRTLLFAVAGYGLCIVIFGLSRNFWLSMAALILSGMCDNISVVVRHTLVQVLTPDALRGRVSAVNSMFIGTSNQLGEFESGLVAHLTSAVFSVVSGGIGTVLVVLGIAGSFPKLRELGALNEIKAEDEKEEIEKAKRAADASDAK